MNEIDAKKTMDELRPGRVLRRCAGLCTLFETYQDVQQVITPNLRDITVSANQVVMFNARSKTLIYSKEGIARYSAEQRAHLSQVWEC